MSGDVCPTCGAKPDVSTMVFGGDRAVVEHRCAERHRWKTVVPPAPTVEDRLARIERTLGRLVDVLGVLVEGYSAGAPIGASDAKREVEAMRAEIDRHERATMTEQEIEEALRQGARERDAVERAARGAP